jgi:hypothetical protein
MSPLTLSMEGIGTPPNGLYFFGYPISNGHRRSTEKVE